MSSPRLETPSTPPPPKPEVCLAVFDCCPLASVGFAELLVFEEQLRDETMEARVFCLQFGDPVRGVKGGRTRVS